MSGSGIRQAALCIHGLSSKDQKWMLKRLPRQQRLTIKGMLRELQSLGIPPNQAWLPCIEEKKTSEKNEGQLSEDIKTKIRQIDKASIYDIKRLLLSESDEFIATLLSIRYWSWKEEILGVFANKRRIQIENILEYRKVPLKPAVMFALVTTIADELTVSQQL